MGKIELAFTAGALLMTLLVGLVLVPVLRKALREEDGEGPRPAA